MVALSSDGEEDARKMAEETGARFPIVYGLDAPIVAQQLGAYYHRGDDTYLHATGFVAKDGEIEVACYSSGAIGRLRASHVLAFFGDD